ncbi:MAG TPA: endonuclease/exonuclease/phosphatase family protein [Bacteroidales bacterium]|nr:endonuclease/exonuclease/phosphatase family protein [Bacteroidales bacterium]
MKTFKRILLITNIVIVAMLIACYFSVYISPSKTLAVALLPFIYSGLLIANALFVVLWLFINWKYSLISALSIVIGIKFLGLIYPVLSLFAGSDTGDLKIMTYNVRVFGLYDWQNNTRIKADIIKLIEEENPDIICLQEVYWNGSDRSFITLDSIKIVLDADYDFRFATSHTVGGQNYGLATISRYQILNSFSLKFDDSRNGFIYNDILINEDTVRIYNCHLQSILLNQNDYTVIEDIAEAEENVKMKIVLKKYLKSLIKRSTQADIVRASIDSCTYPVFVCGDFNDGPLTYTYFTVSKGLRDSFSKRGKFPGYTWDNFGIKQRIDYILYDKQFKCKSHKIIQEYLSDHFPVVAEFDKK